ncbi:unnamed protein product [Caenorhabditis auriculariae]|uniref:TIL domain-containing protein n=1 Tax=Caenorhabditis auriculariae TaxID=2777116 RepID=A0A8S1HWE1_9PELO|nr:unnamed protein product [Caenorhabditis auriculariae]
MVHLITLTVFIAIFAASQAFLEFLETPTIPKCGKNERYSSCYYCEKTCGGPSNKKCRERKCQKGCLCSMGYTRLEKSSPCVTNQECFLSRKCGSVFCKIGTVCAHDVGGYGYCKPAILG